MAKQLMYQQRVFKLTSDFILWNNKDVYISWKEARDDQKLIPLFDSNTIRIIDMINGFEREIARTKIKLLKKELKEIRRQPKSYANKKKINDIYNEMDSYQCKMDYVTVVLQSEKDFDELNKGFKINGIEYRRLLGTPNGVKKSTVIYCSVENKVHKMMYDELSSRLENDRNKLLEQKIRLIIIRRNQIVHEGDIDPLTTNKRDILKSDVLDSIKFINSFVHAVHILITDSSCYISS